MKLCVHNTFHHDVPITSITIKDFNAVYTADSSGIKNTPTSRIILDHDTKKTAAKQKLREKITSLIKRRKRRPQVMILIDLLTEGVKKKKKAGWMRVEMKLHDHYADPDTTTDSSSKQ